MKWLMHLVILTLLLAGGTWVAGWWMVPALGAAYGAWAANQRLTLITATLAGVLAWGALLAYAALLAVSAAALTRGVRRLAARG